MAATFVVQIHDPLGLVQQATGFLVREDRRESPVRDPIFAVEREAKVSERVPSEKESALLVAGGVECSPDDICGNRFPEAGIQFTRSIDNDRIQ